MSSSSSIKGRQMILNSWNVIYMLGTITTGPMRSPPPLLTGTHIHVLTGIYVDLWDFDISQISEMVSFTVIKWSSNPEVLQTSTKWDHLYLIQGCSVQSTQEGDGWRNTQPGLALAHTQLSGEDRLKINSENVFQVRWVMLHLFWIKKKTFWNIYSWNFFNKQQKSWFHHSSISLHFKLEDTVKPILIIFLM